VLFVEQWLERRNNVTSMNLEEVAKRARVSTATVSRVLNNIGVVKTSTRARVTKAITELKYHPNLHAHSLAGGKSRTLGMIVSNMENPFFFDIFQTLEADAHARGYEVVIANTNYRPEQLVTSIRLMIGRRRGGRDSAAAKPASLHLRTGLRASRGCESLDRKCRRSRSHHSIPELGRLLAQGIGLLT
jgi:hypothetical protein